MSLRTKSKVTAEYNMASMTDIVFLLLIFFILTSTITREPILKVLLPKGVKENVQITKPVRIFLDASGTYAVEKNKNVSLESLPLVLENVLKENPGAPISIHADKSVVYEKVMELVRISNQKGAKVVLALDKE